MKRYSQKRRNIKVQSYYTEKEAIRLNGCGLITWVITVGLLLSLTFYFLNL